MRQRSFPIRWHLAIYGVLIVCPLLVVGLLRSHRYAEFERATLQRSAQNIVREVTEAVDRDLERYKAALQTLATSESLAQDNLESFYVRAKQVADLLPDASIGLRYADGRQILFTTVPWGTALLTTQDEHLLAADRMAIESRKAVVSDLFSGVASGMKFIVVEQSIERDGKAAYLLSIGIPPKRIFSVVQSHLGNTGWLLGVTDNSGRIVARSWDHDRYVGQSASPEFLANTEAAAGAFTSTTLDGVAVYNVYVRSTLTGWRFASGIPTSVLETPLYQSLAVVATLAAIGLITSLVLAVLYARFLAAPVSGLRNVAAAVGRHEPLAAFRTGIAELDSVAQALADATVVLRQRDQVQDSLINELNHRVKNTLATVQSIARQTRRRATSLDEFGAAFEGRLMALSRSHDALTRSAWRGGDLKTIVIEACRPFGGEYRLNARGPEVELPPKAVVAIGMVLHELATNAAKYGAFTSANGTVEVSWRVERNDHGATSLHLRWKEHGGPPVVPTEKKGFGTILIVSIVENDLEGKAEFVFEADGARFEAAFPLKADLPSPEFLNG